MPRGSKAAYTDKQKRQAQHIEEGYEKRGLGKEEAESRAWATVNKISGGGKKSGSGRARKPSKARAKKGGKIGGSSSVAKRRGMPKTRTGPVESTRRSASARKPSSPKQSPDS